MSSQRRHRRLSESAASPSYEAMEEEEEEEEEEETEDEQERGKNVPASKLPLLLKYNLVTGEIER